MESNTPKFRLKFNLFDTIVLVLVLLVGAVLLWTALKPNPTASGDDPAASSASLRYVIQFSQWREGTGTLVQPGDTLIDNIKNFQLGTVVSAEIRPCQLLLPDEETRSHVLSEVSGYEDVFVTVESPYTSSDSDTIVDNGYSLRVGATVYLRGNGYMATGIITSIEREGQA